MTGTDRDILISRIIDGAATPEDWTAFKALASQDQAVWADLAEAQQDHAELTAGLAEAIAIADEVEAPIETHLTHVMTGRLRVAMSWSGWAVAAAVVLSMALGLLPGLPDPSAAPTGRASLVPTLTPKQALDTYLTQGQQDGTVLGAEPHVLVETRPMPSGEIEVIFIRQILERTVVEGLYEPSVNELGQPVPVPVRINVRSQPI